MAADIFAFSLSAWAAVTLVELLTRVPLDNSRLALSTFVYVALWLWLFKRLGLYERSFARTIQDEIYATVAAMALGIAPQLILFTIVPSISSSRLVLVVALAFSIAGVTAMRAVAYRTRQIEAAVEERRVALVGDPDRLRAAREELSAVPNTHVLAIPVEHLDLAMATADSSGPSSFEAMPWFSKALRWECDTIIFTDVPDPRHVPALLAAARKWGLQIAFAPPRIRAYAYRLVVDTLGHQALIVPRPIRAASSSTRFVKRAIDVALAGAAIVVTLPVICGCALVLASSERPVLTRETRVGRDGRVFTLLTFTTPVRVLRDLPSLFNVLRGEMSIVGPRPHDVVIAEALRAYNPRYSERTLVSPGITGWAQVNDRRTGDEHELAYDLFYLENWGLFLDAYIAVKAIAALAAGIRPGVKTSA
jgi:lipopolysaccharide/colanic/teichoic acid biosynthesis glycosyltransferase